MGTHDSPRNRRMGALRDAMSGLRPGEIGVIYALGVAVLILTIASSASGKPSYLSPVNISNILDQTAPAAILVVFMTVVLISGNFDLSVESTAALSALIVVQTIDHYGLSGSIGFALLAGAAVGLLNGLIVEYVGINAFIATLGTMTGIRGLVLMMSDGNSVSPQKPESSEDLSNLSSGFLAVNLTLTAGVVLLIVAGVCLVISLRGRTAAAGVSGGRKALIAATAFAGALLAVLGIATGWQVYWTPRAWYALVIALVVWFVLRFTIVGRRVYAVGGNAEAARLSGIHVHRYRVVPFVLSGLAASFVGVLFASQIGAVDPAAMSGLTLTVIAAAILGGTSLFGGSGKVLLSVVGALLLYTIANGFNVLNLGSNYQSLIQGSILIIAAAVYTVGKRREARAPSTRANAGAVPDEVEQSPQDAMAGR